MDVREELVGWIAGIEEERRIEGLVADINRLLHDVKMDYYPLRAARGAVRSIRELPEAMQPVSRKRPGRHWPNAGRNGRRGRTGCV